MKSLIALMIVGASVWIGYGLSGPVFDAAARDLCSDYAEVQGWELVQASGRLGYRRKHNWFTPRSANYWCVFEDGAGETILLDQLDGMMPVTWESRGLRFAGWALMVGPAVGLLAIAGMSGLFKRD